MLTLPCIKATTIHPSKWFGRKEDNTAFLKKTPFTSKTAVIKPGYHDLVSQPCQNLSPSTSSLLPAGTSPPSFSKSSKPSTPPLTMSEQQSSLPSLSFFIDHHLKHRDNRRNNQSAEGGCIIGLLASPNTHLPQEPWYLKINPNGLGIPALIDRIRDNFAVFETSAILLYLADHYDKDFQFSFDPVKEPNEYSEVLQWIFFVVSQSPLPNNLRL